MVGKLQYERQEKVISVRKSLYANNSNYEVLKRTALKIEEHEEIARERSCQKLVVLQQTTEEEEEEQNKNK